MIPTGLQRDIVQRVNQSVVVGQNGVGLGCQLGIVNGNGRGDHVAVDPDAVPVRLTGETSSTKRLLGVAGTAYVFIDLERTRRDNLASERRRRLRIGLE